MKKRHTVVRLGRYEQAWWFAVRVDFPSGATDWMFGATKVRLDYSKSPPWILRNIERLWTEAQRRNDVLRIVAKMGGDATLLTWDKGASV